jgi:hypothetical protein
LAKEFYFQFQDGAVLPSELHHPDREECHENMRLKLEVADLVVRDALLEFSSYPRYPKRSKLIKDNTVEALGGGSGVEIPTQ